MKAREMHGDYGTRLFNIYNNMKQRCLNKNFKQYKDYGGRGISVCKEWVDSYIAFKEWSLSNGYHDTLTIDRIDNDKGYSPDNCRWATHTEQRMNTRLRKDNKTGYKGVSMRPSGRYVSIVFLNGKKHTVGTFNKIKEAVIARNKFIRDNNLPHKIQKV